MVSTFLDFICVLIHFLAAAGHSVSKPLSNCNQWFRLWLGAGRFWVVVHSASDESKCAQRDTAWQGGIVASVQKYHSKRENSPKIHV